MKKLLITMGLPASGKTTFAKEYESKNTVNDHWGRKERHMVRLLDLDRILKKNKNNKEDTINIAIRNMFYNQVDELLIDGLLLSNGDVIKMLNLNCIKSQSYETIEIHYWNSDVESCLWNDKYRRNQNSEITIKNAELQDVDIDFISKETGYDNIVVIKHDIIRKPEWKMFCDKYSIHINNNGIMRSESWSLGGTYGNCWDDGMGVVSTDVQPTSFELLDNLLNDVCPEIPFMKYKMIMNDCVTTDTESEGDYYGGSTESGFFECDIKKLYDYLKESNLVDL